MNSRPPLKLAFSLGTPLVPVTNQPRLIYALLEINGGEGKGSLPVNIGLIIDSSDSMRIRLVSDDQFAKLAMHGKAKEVLTDGVPAYQITDISGDEVKNLPRRIDFVAEALVIANEYLRPADRFSVTAFADQAVRMIPSSPGTERARLQQTARELEYLHLGEGTNMPAGLASAFDEIHHHSNEKFASRLILLTDGHTRNVNECYEWAKRARDVGLTLSTMGVGNEFNEELLIPLADITGGNAYYIESPDQIPDAFRKELGVAFRISYSNMNVRLRLPTEVELRRVHRVMPGLGNFDHGDRYNGSYKLPLGNYDPGVPIGLLLEFLIPGWVEGSYRIANAVLSWDDPENTSITSRIEQDAVIKLANNGTGTLDKRVLNIVERVGAYKFGTHALETAVNSLEKESATQKLRAAASRLDKLGENSLAGALASQADSLERQGSIDPNTTKRLRYETRHIVTKTDK